jgi:hypothetical protein
MATRFAVPLTKGAVALVDECDFERVTAHRWYLTSSGYAARSIWNGGNRRIEYMHRAIMEAPSDVEVDHINHDRVDNRRSNLRCVDHATNARNISPHRDGMSRFRCVSFDKKRGLWVVYARVDGKQRYFGSFEHEEDAAYRAGVVIDAFFNDGRGRAKELACLFK